MSLADHERLELHAHCDALVDGVITEAQRARLEQWLATSEEARCCYVRALTLSASLMDYASEMQAEAPDAPPETARVLRPAAWVWALGSLATAAAIVLAFWLGADQQRSEPDEIASLAQDSDEAIARLSGAKDSRWTGAAPQPGEEFHRGQRIELASGFAEITFDSGAQITLEGPASLDLNSAWDAVLHRGTLKANVPPEAIGFRISNANVNVVDLGTEFSMVADESGATEVFVLKGVVEAAARNAAGNDATPVVLREKQARRFARVGGSEVRDHDAKLARLMRKVVLERPSSPTNYVHWAFDDRSVKSGARPAQTVGFVKDNFDLQLEADNPQAFTPRSHRKLALHFDGRLSGKVRFPGISKRAARTVAFWINIPDDAPLSEGGAMLAWPLGGSGRNIEIGWNRNPTQGALGALRTDFGRGTIIGTTALRDGRWHHIAVVLSPKSKGSRGEPGVQLRQYVDGRLETVPGRHLSKRAKNAGVMQAAREEALWVGRRADATNGERLRGTIDELFVADAALTPQEIRHLMRENKLATLEMLAAQ